MLTTESFSSHSVNKHPKGDAIKRILSEAIQSVDPSALVRKQVQRKENVLWIDGKEYPVEVGRVKLLGIGKASVGMVSPLVDLLADLNPCGLVILKGEPETSPTQVEVQPGGHPIPNENSLLAGSKTMKLVKGLSREDLLLCLISGGGSSLIQAPLPGLNLEDLRNLNSLLLSCGADIHEINTIRRHLDQLKGGGLVEMANQARIVSLILSDVIGNPLEDIASGPTAPDPTTKEEAIGMIEKYQLIEKIPESILKILKNAPETPKPGNNVYERVNNIIIGSNDTATEAAISQAQREGFHGSSLGNEWRGEARNTAIRLCSFFKNHKPERPFCLVGGGESNVTIKGQGKGGRNQELALAAVPEMAKLKDVILITLATDGEEGTTDAAGAVVTNRTLERGKTKGMEPTRYLDNNDSYTYFESLGDLIKTGQTGTNVNDLYLVFGC